MMPAGPTLKPFTLALVQLGSIGENKTGMSTCSSIHKLRTLIHHLNRLLHPILANLQHAREMILEAASGVGHTKKPDLVVLPVRFTPVLTTISPSIE